MQREEPPPDYFEIVNAVRYAATEAETAGNRNAAITTAEIPAIHDDAEAETELANNPDQIPAGAEFINQLHSLVQSTIAYLKHPSSFQGTQNASNSFKGFLDITSKEEKLPLGFAKKVIYKLLLLIYYSTNFIYSIIAVSIQGEHFAYYLVYLFISLTGLILEATAIVVDIQERKRQNSHIQTSDQPREAWRTDAGVHRDYSHKAKSVFVDYVLLSLGELLIYPILICNLYGFINERAWQFHNGISGSNFLLFLNSVLMDMIFTKFYVMWLVKRITKATYTEYDGLFHPRKPLEWKRCFTPVYLTLPFATATALTHWLMTGIIGVRIYVDNFTTEKDIGGTPNTGNYRVAPFTGYMIGFALFLPVFSSAVYVLLNKLWFYEVYSVIHQSTTTTSSPESMPPKLLWNMKLLTFVRDPLALLSVIILMVLFIVFAVGTYLPDYGSSDYEVPSDVRHAVQGLGPCFIIFFLFSNLQAAIIFTIVLLMIATMLLCVLCVVCACLCSHNSEQNST